MVTRIKICGITRTADADAVVGAGADALGLNFVPSSPRRVTLANAQAIAARVRGAVTRVGLFVDPDPQDVHRVLDCVELDVLQFHGGEPAAFCRSFGVPYLKVIRVREPLRVDALEHEYEDACCLLLDTWVDGVAGGTGRRFDWSLWPRACRLPLVLAGGLNPDNVAEAVTRLAPWGVDVSGGVEATLTEDAAANDGTPAEGMATKGKGIKDPERIRRFVAAVRSAEEVRCARS